MAVNGLAAILGGGKDFIPHIEMAALKYVRRAYVMPQRVKFFRDMQGFNPRKVSENLLPGIAKELAEATDIPESQLYRARRAQVDIKEYGDRYLVTDRRAQTDLEDILADVSMALAKALGDKLEMNLINEANDTFIGGTLGSASTDYSVALTVAGQFEFQKERGALGDGTLFHVIHPFQQRDQMQTLIRFDGSGSGAGPALRYRENAITNWNVPGFDGLNVATSSFIPRRIINRVRVAGTGGTFRLSVAGLTTGAITVSTTPATMASNIKTALDALSIGTWTVADGGGGLLDIDVTPPATLFVNADQELKVAVDYATPTLKGQKSAYDLVTGLTGTIGADQYGVNYGVGVQEISASARSLMFYRDALALDERQRPTGNFETLHQGRTGDYSLYGKYGISEWNPLLGMFIETKATSALAVP